MSLDKPLMVELFAGLHGWGEAAVAEGYRVVGYDIVDMCELLGLPRPKGIESILRDVRSITGEECKDAAVIVGSPPCQEPSMRAMPWKRSRALHPSEARLAVPLWWRKKESDMTEREMGEWKLWQYQHPRPAPLLFIELFRECFRIQREASEAAGHYIPLIVENVRGAQKWVGRARWNHGRFYLWGDVPAIMPIFDKGFKGFKRNWRDCEASRSWSSKSPQRKKWSAEIAKIPYPLAQHIARCFYPAEVQP